MTATELYVCSSRRHLYVAAGLAMASSARSHLLVIDQPAAHQDPVLDALRAQPALFASIEVRGKPRGRAGQRAELAFCRDWVAQHRPQRVCGGNDRKYQFQYLIRCARALGVPCRGIYMDDGTGTYESGIHLQFWRGLLDRSLVAWAKRLSIGWWYHRARYFGASHWVDECRVQHPHLLPAPVARSKQVQALEAEMYRAAAPRQVLEHCFLSQRAQLQALDGLRAIVVLPLAKHLPAGAVRDQFFSEIRAICGHVDAIGIKYHPREKQHYFAAGPNDLVIDQDIPAEILFSRCQLDCIVGDTSSALLSAQWLQTGARIVSLCPQGAEQAPLARLLARAGVELKSYAA